MELGIRGKVALVCGASRGIAYATAEELAREGVELVICSRDGNSVREASNRICPPPRVSSRWSRT